MTGYPLNALYEEMAFVGYYLHWPRHELLALEHGERRQWVAEISQINRRLSEVED